MKILPTILLPFCLLVVCRLDAGTGVGISPADATVDTTAGSGPITITMRRATAAVLENTTAGSGIDSPLQVKATNRALLGSQPVLQGSHLGVITGGLVADGVTPLLFRIVASAPTVAPRTYEVKVARPLLSNNGYTGSWSALLLVENNNAFVPGSTVTLSTARPDAYVVVQPVRPEDLQPDGNGLVKLALQVRDAGSVSFPVKVEYAFAVRRPPIALVHGYNADENGWGGAFRTAVANGRGSDFIFRVSYGTATVNGREYFSNIYDSLWKLVATLNRELQLQVEKSSVLDQWAWTRYDAVGHSQGGVLLRMLCSQANLNSGADISSLGIPAFRNADNHQRGRFRRVVTIGSPHAGSTLGHLGGELRTERGVRFGSAFANISDVQNSRWQLDLDRLFQPKFRVGAGEQLAGINAILQCDPSARLHLIRTTIYGGLAPGGNGEGSNPSYYKALYLNRANPQVNGTRPGEVVAPNGADGVVDTDSQEAGGGALQVSRITGEDIIHADIPGLLDETPQTGSTTVGERTRVLLDGPASNFAPVTVPGWLTATMTLRAADIELLADAIAAEQQVVSTACFASSPTAPPPPNSDQVFTFTLDPPAGEAVIGPVEWSASVYGLAGVSSSGLTTSTSGTFGEQLTLTVAASVRGQVVVAARFPSATGKTVNGMPQVVLDRPPGAVLSAIALDPLAIESQAGAEVPLDLKGIYDGVIRSSIFPSPALTSFESSNPGIATITSDGRVKLVSVGAATITATYSGTLVATCAVTVLDDVPAITSSANVAGMVGATLSYQVTASQVVESLSADTLPPGLTLDTQTGLISGTPTSAGRFAAVLTVTNANGTGQKIVEFVIAGVPGAPTDVGLDAAGVNSGKPVGTVVGRLVTVDPNPLDTFTYQLVTGSGSTDNGLFTIAGGSLVTGAVLNGATQSTVSIRVRTMDSSGASFEKALVLPVGTPPTIARQPDARVVFVGESATFVVEATGLEPRQYQWKKGGADVGGATSRIFEVTAAALEDAGNYTVVVTNGDGSVTSAAASLVVKPISYGRWASALPPTQATALFEPAADYNADGVVNFLEFAFGVTAGIESGVEALPTVYRDAFGPVLLYREANQTEPLTFRILKSVNLGMWTEHVPTAGETTRTNLGAYTEVRVRVPGPTPGAFYKIEVSSP